MDKALWDKNLPKIPLSSFYVSHLLLGMGPAIFTQKDSIREINFSFAGGSQLAVAYGLGMGMYVYFHTQHCDSIWLSPLQVLCMLAYFL